MTDDPTGQTGADVPRRFLETSERSLRDVLEAVEQATRDARIEAGQTDADLARTILGLAKTRAMVIREIKTHDQRSRLSKGGAGEEAHDFDAIRDRLGRQLDRLRDARGAGGFFE